MEDNKKFIVYFLSVFAIYIVLALYFCGLKGGGIPWVNLTQFVLASIMLCNFFVFASAKGSWKYLFFFLSFLLSCFFLKYQYVSNGLSPFGSDPVDSILYMQLANKTSTLSLGDAMRMIANYDKIDDIGMPVVARLCYMLGGSDDGYYNVLILFNTIAVTVSTLFVYKSSLLIFDKETARLISAIYVSTCQFSLFATTGLKENFFLLIIILSIYYLLKMYHQGISSGIIGFLVFTPLICFFRLAVIAQIIMALGAAVLLKSKKYRWFGIASVVIVTVYIVTNYMDLIIDMLGGGSLESWIIYAEAHNTGQSPFFQYFSQSVFSVIGNPPMFNIVDELDFVHFASFSACVRSFLSPFFIIGMIEAGKKIEISKLFLVIYWLVGTFMLIVVLRGSDFRYSSMYYLPFLILTMEGFNKRKNHWYSKYLCVFIYFVSLVVTRGWNL